MMRKPVVVIVGLLVAGRAAPAAAQPAAGDLAVRTKAILKANCHRCHGADGSKEGGTIKREAWESTRGLVSVFQETARRLDLGTPVRVR